VDTFLVTGNILNSTGECHKTVLKMDESLRLEMSINLTNRQSSQDDSIKVSIIVPVYNNPKDLIECISAIKENSLSCSEIIVVNDGSTDNTEAVAKSLSVKVQRLNQNEGGAAARNHGVQHASGEILIFIDSDVVVRPYTIAHIMQFFNDHPDFAGIFGSYDTDPRAKNFVSQYRNLLHHYVHQCGNSEASTFWSGCGAIRRSAFERVGGFTNSFTNNMEDVELGYRLKKVGYRIRLDKTLQVTHLKQWTFKSMIKADVMRRALPWSRLILEAREFPNDLNVEVTQRVSVTLVMMGIVLLLGGAVWTPLLLGSAAVISATILLNRSLFAFFFRQRGLRFAFGCIPLYLLYYLYSGIAFLIVWIECWVLCRGKSQASISHNK
jgi:GT2 family glycosyltransferase